MNKKLIIALLIGVSFCGIANAEDCPIGKILMWNGSCQFPSGSCGSNCTYTLDQNGNLNITGSGQGRINDMFFNNKSIKNLTIESGIATIGLNAFRNATNIQNVTIGNGVRTIEEEAFDNIGTVNSFIMPDTITSIGTYSLQSISGAPVVVPPNAVVSWRGFWTNTQIKYCTNSQINICKDEGRSSDKVILYEKKGNLYYVYDSDNNISEIYGGYGNFNNNVLKEPNERDTFDINDDGSVSIMDKNGKMMATYSQSGVLMAQYNYGSDGSVSIYDANWNLIGLKGKRILTVEEASALVKDNKNTFKLKYR